jgi:hypothetical protein
MVLKFTKENKIKNYIKKKLHSVFILNLGFFFFLSLSCFLRICHRSPARPLARASFLPFTFLRAQGRRSRSARLRKTSSRLIGRNRNCSVRARRWKLDFFGLRAFALFRTVFSLGEAVLRAARGLLV